MNVIAYSYGRMSTPEQSEGDSMRRQDNHAEEYSKRNGLTLSPERFFDVASGWRGANRKKGALSRFLVALQEGRITRGSYLLVENTDRLTREPILNAFRLVSDILSFGIIIVTLNDGQMITEEALNSNSMHAFMLIAKITIANGESNEKGRRSKINFEQKRRKAQQKILFSKSGPGWLEWSDEAGWFEKHPKNALAVVRMFELAAEGVSLMTIARSLHADGFQPFGTERNRTHEHSGTWRTGFISKVLRNEAVMGTFVTRTVQPDGTRILTGDKVLEYYPTVITPELFARTRATIRPRNSAVSTKGRTYANLLIGLARCGKCGERMAMNVVKHIHREHRYLICEGKRSRKSCDLVNFRYNDVEEAVLKNITRFTDIDNKSRIDPTTLREAIAAKEYEISDLKQRISSLLDILEKAETGTQISILERITRRRAEIEPLEQKLSALQAEENHLESKNLSIMEGPDVVARLLDEAAALGGYDSEAGVTLRSRLAAALRSFLTTIRFEPSGHFVAVADGHNSHYSFGPDYKFVGAHGLDLRGKNYRVIFARFPK